VERIAAGAATVMAVSLLAVATTAPAVQHAGLQELRLELATTISPSPATRGRAATFEIRATNRTGGTLTNVRLELELEPADRLVSTSVPCSGRGAVLCSVGTIAPGAEAAVAITIRPRTLGVSSRFVTGRADQGFADELVYLLVCTIVGTPGSDRISGTSKDDTICGAGGADVIMAARGDDRVLGTGRLFGGPGNDGLSVSTGVEQREPESPVKVVPPNGTRLDGGPGDDFLRGGAGDDRVRGGSGRDELEGWGGRDWLGGAAGSDRLNGMEGDDSLDGGSGDDSLAGHHGDDIVRGAAGNDLVLGGYFNESNERLRPGGDDRLFGGPGPDRVVGGKGRDVVDGGRGQDQLFGGLNDDLLLARDGFADELEGRRGFDRARVDSFDRVSGVERVSRA
jgi:Ca2+-binding RTX toxin-like protein